MKKSFIPQRHVISGAFVFLLLGIFATFSTVLVLLSAQAYRNVVDLSDVHNNTRILTAHIRNALRADDAKDTVGVSELAGVPVLTITARYDEEDYIKYLYVANGKLRELFISSAQDFDPEDGDILCSATAFLPKLEDGLFTAEIIDASGQSFTMHMALRCQS